MATVGLAWVLKNPVVVSPIIGPTKPKHLIDAAAALELTLTDDEIAALEGPYAPRELTYFWVDGSWPAARAAGQGLIQNLSAPADEIHGASSNSAL